MIILALIKEAVEGREHFRIVTTSYQKRLYGSSPFYLHVSHFFVQLARVAVATVYSKRVIATLINSQGGSWIPAGGITFNTEFLVTAVPYRTPVPYEPVGRGVWGVWGSESCLCLN